MAWTQARSDAFRKDLRSFLTSFGAEYLDLIRYPEGGAEIAVLDPSGEVLIVLGRKSRTFETFPLPVIEATRLPKQAEAMPVTDAKGEPVYPIDKIFVDD